MARQERITVMLEGSVKDRVHFYATSMGLTDSALGAYIFGNWIFQQDKANGPMFDEMKKLMMSAVIEQMDVLNGLVNESGEESDGEP